MVSYLIKNGRVVDPSCQKDIMADVLITDGKIVKIAPNINDRADKIIEAKDCVVSPGFVDLHCHLREPGFEYKETIKSGTESAVAGGYIAVCCMANTQPVNDNASITDYILKQAKQEGSCHVYPIGAITKGLKGEELASIAELKSAGCVAISDDGWTVQNASLMRLGLAYAKTFGLPVSTHCIEANLAKDGSMNESIISTKLGLKGSPNAAEDIIIARDIMLAEITGAHLHVGHLSTRGGIDLVRDAKKRGLKVTCEVTPHHFSLTDEAVLGYDTNCKMCPPLRRPDDVEAIKKALQEGDVIDAIATDHAPHGTIDKEVEFDKAAFGIIGFETALPLSLELVRSGLITLSQMIALFTNRPSQVFQLPHGHLQEGSLANVTVFNPELEWTVNAQSIFSKSKNSPYLGKTLKGKTLYTFVDGKLKFDSSRGIVRDAI